MDFQIGELFESYNYGFEFFLVGEVFYEKGTWQTYKTVKLLRIWDFENLNKSLDSPKWEYVHAGWFETSHFFKIEDLSQLRDRYREKALAAVNNVKYLTAAAPIRDFIKLYNPKITKIDE